MAEIQAANQAIARGELDVKDRPEIQTDVSYYVTFYRQPWHNYVAAWMYHRWDRASWRLMNRIEKPFNRHHRRHCNDDCGDGFDGRTGEPMKSCFYIPLSNRQDLRCYDLGNRHRVSLGTVENVPEDVYNAIGDRYDT